MKDNFLPLFVIALLLVTFFNLGRIWSDAKECEDKGGIYLKRFDGHVCVIELKVI